MTKHPLDDLDDDMRDHIERQTAENIERGMSPEEARYAARRAFGSIALTGDRTRDVWISRWLQAVVQDTRYALRGFRRNPGFTTVAVVTLALAIGASTALYSALDAALLRPLSYSDADRLVLVESWRKPADRQERTSYSYSELSFWKANAQAFDALALSQSGLHALGSEEGADMVNTAAVSPEFFETLRGGFVAGRSLASADDPQPLVVISERLWRRRFEASPAAIGRSLSLASGGKVHRYEIVGVANNEFQYPTAKTDVWIPAGYWIANVFPDAAKPTTRGFALIGRLKANVDVESAGRDAERVANLLNVEREPADTTTAVIVTGLQESVAGSARSIFMVLVAAVGLVLLVACANVANLLLARNASRTRELATRQALGASHERLMSQMLVESAVLATTATLVGLFIADAIVAGIQRVGVADAIPRFDAARLNGRVLLFACAVSFVAALVAGVPPALQNRSVAWRSNFSAGVSHRRLRSTLVITEVAISVVLLTGAILLMRSLGNLIDDGNIGVRSDGVVAAEVNLQMGRPLSSTQQVALVTRLVDALSRLPGVTAAGVGNGLPPGGVRMRAFLDARDPVDGQERTFTFGLVPTTQGFFTALSIPLLHGRLLNNDDTTGGTPVMVLSASAARDLFGTTDVVGRTLDSPKATTEKSDVTIVGVVGDVKYFGLEGDRRGIIYRPFAQYPFRNVFVVARTESDPATVRRAIGEVDPELTVSTVGRLDTYIQQAAMQPRFRTISLAALASVAVVLAIIGLYGVVAYAVSQRTHEIGVRVALGAAGSDIVGMVLLEGAALAFIGGAIGLAVSYALWRTVTSFLYGLKPTDPLSFAGAVSAVMVLSIAAAYVPGRRASKIDPLVALRCE